MQITSRKGDSGSPQRRPRLKTNTGVFEPFQRREIVGDRKKNLINLTKTKLNQSNDAFRESC